jgi:lauroyl/myristoyl acyltransferase
VQRPVRGLGRLAGAVARVEPRAGLALAGALGARLGPRAGPRRCPPERWLAHLLPELDAAELARARREIASLEFRNRALRRLLERRGVAPLLPLLEVRAEPLLELLAARERIVVASWHMGPYWASSAALEKLGVPALFAVHRARPARGARALRWFELADELPARFLKRAVDELAAGRTVGMALDFPLGALARQPFLGGTLAVARGAAAVARIAGARLVPVTRRWIGRSSRIEVTFHAPIPEPAAPRAEAERFEAELLAAALRFFEERLRADPGSLRIAQLRQLLAPRAAAPGGG